MDFNEKVWSICKQIPMGKITTYKAIAEALQSKAYRAVGNALNKNPHAPVVPCHRVISSTGHLQGFAYGLEMKKQLLEKEGLFIENNRVVNFEKFLHKLL